MCGKDFTVKHPAWRWQLGHQEELCFSCNHFWDSLNPFLSCQYLFFSWYVARFGSFVSLTPEPLGWSIRYLSWVILPSYFCQRFQEGPFFLAAVYSSFLISSPDLTGPRAVAWILLNRHKCLLFRNVLKIILLPHGRVYNLEYPSSKKQQLLGKPILPSCWLVGI